MYLQLPYLVFCCRKERLISRKVKMVATTEETDGLFASNSRTVLLGLVKLTHEDDTIIQ